MNFIKKSKDVNIGEMTVKDVKLKKSVLTRSGPVYSDMAVFKLEGSEHE
jgi:2'-5' RNA ligase